MGSNKRSWTTISLGDFISLQRGHDLTSTERKEGTVPVFGAAGQNGFHNRSITKGPGIVIGRSGGSFGQVHLSKQDFWPHNTALYVTDFKGNDPYFTYYLLQVLNFSALNSGSAQPSLNRNFLYPLKITVPEQIEQKKIGRFLRALDEKIELNNKLNDNLEQMAKTLYDYWFVQFDFPDKNGKPYKASGGKMVYSDVLNQVIPEEWVAKPLEALIAKSKNGDWGKEVSEGNYISKVQCIRGTDINGVNGKGEIQAPVRYILEKNTSKILAAGDLVIEISGGSPVQSTGRLAYITDEVLDRFENPLICSNFCKAISLHSKNLFFYFTYSWNKAYETGVFFGFEGKTSGIKNLLFDTLVRNYYIPEPADELLADFHNKIETFEKQRQINLKQSQQLALLRDWLLPLLMNGQVSIK